MLLLTFVNFVCRLQRILADIDCECFCFLFLALVENKPRGHRFAHGLLLWLLFCSCRFGGALIQLLEMSDATVSEFFVVRGGCLDNLFP